MMSYAAPVLFFSLCSLLFFDGILDGSLCSLHSRPPPPPIIVIHIIFEKLFLCDISRRSIESKITIVIYGEKVVKNSRRFWRKEEKVQFVF